MSTENDSPLLLNVLHEGHQHATPSRVRTIRFENIIALSSLRDAARTAAKLERLRAEGLAT